MNSIIGIGAEIVECLRIRRMIEKHGELFLTRVYTDAEIRACQDRRQTTEYFAAFWAAKEAVFKSLGKRWRKGMSWTEIEIHLQTSGATTVELQGAAKELADSRGVGEVMVTIAYCRAYATANAIAMGG